MGWFLRSSQKKKKKRGNRSKKTTKSTTARQRAATSASRLDRLAAQLKWTKRIGVAITVGVMVAGLVWAERRLPERIRRHLVQSNESVQINIHGLPAWMPRTMDQQLLTMVDETIDDRLFEVDRLEAVYEKMLTNPWVRRVVSVTRRAGRIDVTLQFRTPVAMIEAVDGYHLIDAQTHRLPWMEPAEPIVAMALPVITGVADQPPKIGRRWRGEDVKIGLKMVTLINRQSWSHQIHAINVSNAEGRRWQDRPHVMLVTQRDGDQDPRNNPGIGWGRPPGEEAFYEPSVDVKLGHIQKLIYQYQSIDAGGQQVDVSSDVISIYPIQQATSVRQVDVSNERRL